ncbi:unnamed protein product [Didymodactylos carnosus]|uniref:Dynein regulatory complex subunit 2 n=1 Tax=Didymodactylos carnosus TaxID=1234261 RepID=A0A814G1L7_9BILA|nr:unnamed protein product [Didymodactylos carnosus]CAF1215851.1 unnamed protein product [Didymodactylos carnosus]CAF3762074.1 unnamed protein product [Didymodactylos carnosus]CAF4024339.1 unnamed protein product [Didymodactylos carnosus]
MLPLSAARRPFGNETLIYNWREERADIKYERIPKPLPSQYDHYFGTTYEDAYGTMRGCPPRVETRGLELSREKAFPGHQPEFDTNQMKSSVNTYLTEYRAGYCRKCHNKLSPNDLAYNSSTIVCLQCTDRTYTINPNPEPYTLTVEYPQIPSIFISFCFSYIFIFYIKSLIMEATEEDLLATQKALEEEVQNKVKEAVMSQFLREKLSREEKFTERNMYKLNTQWLAVMRLAKSKELLKEIEILSQTFGRIIDRKDTVIKASSKDINEAEEQYNMALRSFFEALEKMISMHTTTVDKLLNQYELDVEQVKNEFQNERNRIIRDHDTSKTELQDIIYNMEKTFLDSETSAENNFHAMMEELKNKYREDMQQYQLSVEARSIALQNEMTTISTNYKERTKESKAQYQEYKTKDEKNSKEIRDNTTFITKITEKVNVAKGQIAALEASHTARMSKISQEKENMKRYLLQLKSQLLSMQEELRRRLTRLATTCDSTEKQLEKRVKIAEILLTFAEMSRKLEAEEEKILPFYVSTLTEEEKADVEGAFYETPIEDIASEMYKYDSLETFWKRFSKVSLDKLTLEKERSILQSENMQLKLLLKQYLDGISVNDEIMSQTNPLMILTSRRILETQSVGKPSMSIRPTKVVIEAQHVKSAY